MLGCDNSGFLRVSTRHLMSDASLLPAARAMTRLNPLIFIAQRIILAQGGSGRPRTRKSSPLQRCRMGSPSISSALRTSWARVKPHPMRTHESPTAVSLLQIHIGPQGGRLEPPAILPGLRLIVRPFDGASRRPRLCSPRRAVLARILELITGHRRTTASRPAAAHSPPAACRRRPAFPRPRCLPARRACAACGASLPA
jgi:hypothetical protein